MAILRAIPRKARHPSYTGRVMIDAVRGVLRVRKWPKKRGTPRSERQRWWIDWFKQANLLAKYADPMSQIRAKEMTAGSGMYPRDVLLKAMRGRLYWWTDENGWKWFSMAAISDISDTLDVLAQTIGSVLVRATDRWRAPPEGNPGDVLTYHGTATPPTWEAGGGGGATFGGCLVQPPTTQAIPKNTYTPVTWDTEVYDTDSIHDNAVNPTRLTVPAGWTRVRLTCNIQWSTSSTLLRLMLFWKNGATFPGNTESRRGAYTYTTMGIVSPPLDCVGGDYFECAVYQNTAGTQQILGQYDASHFSMERIS